MAKTFKILSVDGGGVRGLIPATVLAEIEKRTGKRISDMFDLIAGTSTGGIIALGLTKPADTQAKRRSKKPQFTAEQIAQLYLHEGNRIFSRSVWHRLRSIGNAIEEKYPSEGIDGVLNEYFGNAKLADATTDVLVTSYELQSRKPFFFTSKDARRNKGYNFYMKQAARATSAAPTYFEPILLKEPSAVRQYALVDGGVFANNPAMCAYVEMLAQYPPPGDVLIVSLGTGNETRPIKYEDAKGWGLVQWAQPLFHSILSGVSDTVDYQLRQLFPVVKDEPRRYYRFNIQLDMGNDDLDDASQTNLFALKTLGERIISGNNKTLDQLCGQLAG